MEGSTIDIKNNLSNVEDKTEFKHNMDW